MTNRSVGRDGHPGGRCRRYKGQREITVSNARGPCTRGSTTEAMVPMGGLSLVSNHSIPELFISHTCAICLHVAAIGLLKAKFGHFRRSIGLPGQYKEQASSTQCKQCTLTVTAHIEEHKGHEKTMSAKARKKEMCQILVSSTCHIVRSLAASSIQGRTGRQLTRESVMKRVPLELLQLYIWFYSQLLGSWQLKKLCFTKDRIDYTIVRHYSAQLRSDEPELRMERHEEEGQEPSVSGCVPWAAPICADRP